MDIPILSMILIFLTFQFTFTMLDSQHNTNLKTNLFSMLRTANQNALIEMQPDYNEYEEITDEKMLEAWLENFVKNNDLGYDEVELSFVQIETDPPLFLVTAKAKHGNYFIAKKEAVVTFYSGTTIISDNHN